MKKIIAAITLLAFVTACSAQQVQTSTHIGNSTCDVFRTISWAIPIVEALAFAGQLSSSDQAILDDAMHVVNAGCNASDASLLGRADAIAIALVSILWPSA